VLYLIKIRKVNVYLTNQNRKEASYEEVSPLQLYKNEGQCFLTKTLFSLVTQDIVGAYSGGKKALKGLGRQTICISLLFSMLICLANIPHVESESYSVSWTSPNMYSWGVGLNATIGVGFFGYPSIVELYLSPEVAVANQTTELRDDDRRDYFYLEEALQHLTYYTATLVYGEENDLQSYIWIFVSEDSLLRSVSPKPGSSNVNLDEDSFVMKFAKLPSIVELTLEPEVPIVDTKILIFSTQAFPPGGTDHYYFFPDELLQPETTYTATLIFGEENNTRSFTWSFTTVDPENPKPQTLPYAPFNLFPEPDSIDVPLDTNISLSISRPPSIVNMSISPEVPINGRTDETVGFNGRYTFHLSELLEPSTTYSVTIVFGDHGAPEGYAPTNTRTWNFTTIALAEESKLEQTGIGIPFVEGILAVLVIVVAFFVLYYARRNLKQKGMAK